MRKVRVYINLTTGLELLPLLKDFNPVIIRIESSHIESKAWDKIFSRLDADLLFHLALGYRCYIVDASNKERGSKVLRIGIPVIKYVLTRIWFKKELETPEVRKLGLDYLRRIFRSLGKDTRNKLKYYRVFLETDAVDIRGIGVLVNPERSKEYYAEMARRILLES